MSSVTGPTQIAYFFVPLSETLALPERFTLEITRPASFDEHVERIRLADVRGDLDADPAESLFTASLRFWHGSVPSGDFDLVEQLFITAERALPGLSQPQGTPSDSKAAPITIVELAVPLCTGLPDPVSTAFDEGLRVLRGFQRAYHLVRKAPLKLVARQHLPAMIPFGVRKVSETADEWPKELSLLQLNWNVTPIARDAALTSAELEHIQFALEAQPGQRVFASYADLRRDAIRTLNIEGDYRAVVLFSAAAAEVLFDDLLAHMLWEEGVHPEDAAGIFEGGLQKRIRSHYHMRLGGSGWGLAGPGALSQWNADVARIRHRVIHAGYDPASQEAARAVDALLSLESFLGERLLSEPLAKYPRTAMAFYGRSELERRQKWDIRLQDLADNVAEPAWAPTFVRWKATMQSCRSERPPDAVVPRFDNALVVGVAHPGPILIWVLHDRDAQRAHRAAPPYAITPEQSNAVTKFLNERPEDAAPASLVMFGARAEPLPQFGWVPEYRLLPMAGVMVTGLDLDPPLEV